MSYYTNTAGRRLWMPEPSLEPPEVPEQAREDPKPIGPLPGCTLTEIKEYCEEWEDCPRDSRCVFWRLCMASPCEWRLEGGQA